MILIAEDDVSFARVYCRVLELNGYDSLCFTTGMELLAALRQERVELLILDLGLPGGMDGFEVASRARQMGYIGPMFAISGIITQVTKPQLDPHGFTVFMPKPLPLNDLIKEVEEATGRPSTKPGAVKLEGDK